MTISNTETVSRGVFWGLEITHIHGTEAKRIEAGIELIRTEDPERAAMIGDAVDETV